MSVKFILKWIDKLYPLSAKPSYCSYRYTANSRVSFCEQHWFTSMTVNMGKVDDIAVARNLTSAAKELRPAVAAFADAVSQENINYRAEMRSEKLSSKTFAEFESALCATYAEARSMEASNKNLADGIRGHARAIADEFAIDVILHQRAKIKYNARKKHFESRPAMERVLTSPRAKNEDVLLKEQDSRHPFAEARDGALPAATRNVKSQRAGASAYHMATVVFAVAIIALGLAIAFAGVEESSVLIRRLVSRLEASCSTTTAPNLLSCPARMHAGILGLAETCAA
jgi:hypothetical protein